jgi:glutathione synthase/RimK-type ligase-like ATP-grasp enzyme
MLLIVTNKYDLSCDFFILRLKERNIPFVRLNTEDYGEQFDVTIYFERNNQNVELKLDDGRVINESQITGVYFRQPVRPKSPSDVVESHKAFVERETNEMLRSFWRSISREKWLNHPRDLWVASNKPEQLKIAREFCFCVPDTCISCSYQNIRKFAKKHDFNVVCKALKHGFLKQKDQVKVAPTQRIDKHFFNNFTKYADTPMILQREIAKEFDVRVTVVGRNVFAAAIFSQEHKITSLDWRLWDAYDVDLKHEALELPDELRQRCLNLTSYYNLNYSAIDLIKDVAGNFHFLEMNPNGQWAWIEQKVQHPIRDALIDQLVDPHGSKH